MTSTGTTHEIIGFLAGKLALGEITASTSFAELELDSLVLLELSVLLEQKYRVRIPEDELVEADNVNAVVAIVDHRRPAMAA
ncbi:phosphopantetheine-binding protein [Streptomyces sp. NBC_00503]|uniref:phosphopantetheine-binding protein n=1 Tax=Streptomyces sp. NBC_00503 TaxID=2903659 RepID=UPI002E81DA7E|nr:phosphopantetheine-binding protein [Streptomyces sp. NBC_00503]WUD86371.1 phosphopantetheine-binding protein [Streptomyces sp. NBC_00503]